MQGLGEGERMHAKFWDRVLIILSGGRKKAGE